MTTQSSNLANSNVSVSLLSNNSEWLSKIQKKIREQAKLDVFQNLDFDKRKFTDIAETISEIKEIKKDDSKSIDWLGAIKLKYKTLKKQYNSIFEKYKNAGKDEKELMYMELAERVILDRWWVVAYEDWGTITEDFVRNEYNLLNEEDKYKDKLDFFTIKNKKDWKLYIIKWKADELKKIKEREKEIRDKMLEESENKLANEKKEWNENYEDLKKKYDELKEENKEQSKQIEKLIEKLNAKDENTGDEPNDIDSNKLDEKDSQNDYKLENSETLDENSNYISRSFVEGLIVGIRWAEGYPKWTIRIREEVINVEEFEFYEEFKQEYIEAKWDATKLSRLDKEFAEMIILFSPKWADYKNKYCIKLSESELKDGLYVSDKRLARYGVRINVTKYEHEVVEKEIIRERKIVEKIETTITELQTQILELTTSISIEKYNKEVILEEIKSKKELLVILIKRYKALKSSLEWLNNNDEELKKLREEESRLQKELKELNKQKNIFNKIQEALDSIPEETKETIRIVTNDWKICTLENGKRFFRITHNNSDLFNDLRSVRKASLLKILKESGNIKEIIIWNENMPNKPQKFSIPEDINDIDTKIADIEKQLADIKEKIDQKESSNRNRISLWEFYIWENWYLFRDYCKRNWIKRKDRKPFDENSLESDYMDTEYVDKDGRTLKLEYINWAEDDWYDKPQTKAEFVYYEESWNWAGNELESQLTIIIEEWEALLVELTELEESLRTEKEEKIKLTIKQRIEEINKKLIIISQKYTKFEQFIHVYKSKTKITKYSIFQIVPIEPIPVPDEPFEMTSVISDMWTDVFKEKAALKVEEELKRQYKSLWRWQMWSRLALFLWRWSKRKKMMKNEMNNMANTAFQTNTAYATLNEQSQNAADRHGHELLTNMAAVNRITTVHNPHVDQLCKDYLNGRETDSTFQTKFNAIVAADANIQNALNGQNITHIGTNILLQLKEQKALHVLIGNLDRELNSYLNTYNTNIQDTHIHNMENFIEKYIKDYQKLPAFKATFEQFLKWDLNARNNLKAYLDSHVKSIIKMQITNLRMNIDILNKWKSAYQIDNKDREKWWKYKLWRLMDKHPWWTAIGSIAIWVWLWLVTAPMSAVAWAAITTWVFGSYVWFTNYIKKWTHHTKEQNTHEKNVVTDYRNEQAKIQNWQNDALNGKGRKKYKAKRQLALYDQTTQENIKLSNQIAEYITNLSAKSWPLTPKEANEYNFMQLNLIEWWARLKYYREMWHNFLASENVDKTEEDMRRLEKAITLWLQKIGKTTNDIETTMTATNGLGTNITYAVIRNDLKASYDKSMIQFKRERKNLALKYGISTAALSIGTALWLQYLTGSGVFAKDIPGTPWTPWTPSATSNHPSGTDNFWLWKYDIPWTANYADSGNIYSNTKSLVSSSSIPDWSHAVINYWVGTDGTTVRAWSLWTKVLKAQLKAVEDNINAMSWWTHTAQRDAFLAELGKLKSIWFTNDNLATMRAAEELEHYAQGIADWMASTWKNIIVDWFNRWLDKSGTLWDNVAERFMTWSIDITTPAIPWTPGTPGIPAKTWGRWIMGVPLFFNTFKKRKPNKNETTDQNFWQWNNQQRPQQPNQPQQNQNQPQNP